MEGIVSPPRIDNNVINLKQFIMKQKLLKFIWNTLSSLGKGNKQDYETAPYCGHHYQEFENKYISESYHEGEGGGFTKISFLGYIIEMDNVYQSGTMYHLVKKQ